MATNNRQGAPVDASWKVADAKNRLSELLDRAQSGFPQEISRRGTVFVVVERDQYETEKRPGIDFKDWLLRGPDFSELELERDRSAMRDVD